jgi:hypothetical protein
MASLSGKVNGIFNFYFFYFAYFTSSVVQLPAGQSIALEELYQRSFMSIASSV